MKSRCSLFIEVDERHRSVVVSVKFSGEQSINQSINHVRLVQLSSLIFIVAEVNTIPTSYNRGAINTAVRSEELSFESTPEDW